MKTNRLAKVIGIATFCLWNVPNTLYAQISEIEAPLTSLALSFNGQQYVHQSGKWIFNDGAGYNYEVIEDQITIKFNAGVTNAEISIFEADHNLSQLRKAVTGWTDYEITANAGTIFSLAQTLQDNAIVDQVELSSTGELMQVPNDTSFPSQWGFQLGAGGTINLPEAWDLATGSNTVKVGVIDSGVDFESNDLGMGTDGYENIYTNPGEDAWADPNDPTTGNGIDDDGNGLIDDWKGWNFGNNNNDSRSSFGVYHGTRVGSIISAKTNNDYGIAGVAGGWGTEGAEIISLPCEHPVNGYIYKDLVDDAILYAVDQGAKIINMSIAIGTSQSIIDAIQIAKDEGVLLIAAAGNNYSTDVITFPASHPDVLAVGGSNPSDDRWGGGSWGSNSGSKLDIVAPGESIASIGASNGVSSHSGTSFAAPIVSGVAALMLEVNPCLTPAEIKTILLATAEKTGGYNYNWNYNRPGHSKEMGYGRLDAFAAVTAAQNLYSPAQPDLAIHDHFTDYGADGGYTFTWDFDESPDIWARNQNDGETNQYPEEIEFTADPTNPAFIYVRIWNHSCVVASGQTLDVYASAAGSNGNWPSGWTNISEGGQHIASVSVPDIEPGGFVIMPIEWVMIFSPNQCLMARVESAADPIVNFPGDLSQEIYQNNNIALRNLIVNNIFPGKAKPVLGDVEVPHGTSVTVGNNHDESTVYDFEFFDYAYESETTLSSSAELTLHFTEEGWTVFEPYLRRNRNVRIMDNYTVEVLSSHLYLNDIAIPGRTYFPIHVGYSFLTDEIDEQTQYEYHVVQKNNEEHEVMGDHWTGGVHLYVYREEREPFSANAGDDKYIASGESIELTAVSIGEEATYNWYNEAGDLVHEGERFFVTPRTNQRYSLEVIAVADGYKDYDEVSVSVSPYSIELLTPNPASEYVTVTYNASGAETAYLKVNGLNVSFTSENISIDPGRSRATIDVSTFPEGIHTVTMVCDGVVVDAEMLSVE